MALTTTTRARVLMGNPTTSDISDADLTILIDAASASFERLAHRTFNSTAWTERYDGVCSDTLILNQYPIISVSRVVIGSNEALLVQNTDATTNQRAAVRVTSTGLTLTRMASATETTSSLLFATYTTITTLAAAIEALGSGWDATIVSGFDNFPTAWLFYQQGNVNALRGGSYLKLFHEELTDYQVRANEGMLLCASGWDADPGEISVEYTAGYATIPDDIQNAVAQWAGSMWDDMQHDGNLIRERLGSYEWERASNAAQSNWVDQAIPADVRLTLSSYTDRR